MLSHSKLFQHFEPNSNQNLTFHSGSTCQHRSDKPGTSAFFRRREPTSLPTTHQDSQHPHIGITLLTAALESTGARSILSSSAHYSRQKSGMFLLLPRLRSGTSTEERCEPANHLDIHRLERRDPGLGALARAYSHDDCGREAHGGPDDFAVAGVLVGAASAMIRTVGI